MMQPLANQNIVIPAKARIQLFSDSGFPLSRE